MSSSSADSMKFLLLAILAFNILSSAGAEASIPVRKPLPYRIVSFHRGRADKALIQRAAELGFNGVMFQLEGGNVGPLKEFAERNEREGYVALCHSLGMKVTLWVHELSDIPERGDPGYLGPIEVGNEKLWLHLEDRYEWLFGELLPDIDGVVLTVAETQYWATDTDIMGRIVNILRDKCHKYNKQLIVRTFVHTPSQFESVMACVKQLPPDAIIMSKCVPQDWQLRSIYDKAIGGVGAHDQIVEYDIGGEYFLLTSVANCMPGLLKKHFDYGLRHGVDGICVRVDRGDCEVLHQPSEVNLWALGMFASGRTDSVDDAWQAWAKARYGEKAAPGVIRALKPTEKVITECLSIGPFTYGDARGFPPPGIEEDVFNCNWQNWRWDPSFIPARDRALAGDMRFLRQLQVRKSSAMRLAQQSLDDLELVKDALDPADCEILKTKLTTNKVNIELRAPMMLANVRYKRILNTNDEAEKRRQAREIRKGLQQIRAVADRDYPPAREIEHLGQRWRVGPPEGMGWPPGGIDWAKVRQWVDRAEKLLAEQGL